MSNDRHKHMPITGEHIGVGPKNISLAQLSSVYHHYCDDQIEEGHVRPLKEGEK